MITAHGLKFKLKRHFHRLMFMRHLRATIAQGLCGNISEQTIKHKQIRFASFCMSFKTTLRCASSNGCFVARGSDHVKQVKLTCFPGLPVLPCFKEWEFPASLFLSMRWSLVCTVELQFDYRDWRLSRTLNWPTFICSFLDLSDR